MYSNAALSKRRKHGAMLLARSEYEFRLERTDALRTCVGLNRQTRLALLRFRQVADGTGQTDDPIALIEQTECFRSFSTQADNAGRMRVHSTTVIHGVERWPVAAMDLGPRNKASSFGTIFGR